MDLLWEGVTVMMAGLALMVLASLLSTPSGEEGKTKVRGGGVVMIGPIPIIFGSDTRWTILAILLAIILMLLSIIFYLL